MAQNTQRIGWIGMGRMGYPMAERLLKAGYDVSIWNRTKSKAEPLGKLGGKVVDKPSELAGVDVLFSIVAEGKDVEAVYFGKDGVASGNGKLPGVFVDCSTIAVEESADIRQRLKERGADYRLRAGERQRQGHQGRQAVLRVLGPGSRIPQGRGHDQGVRAEGRVLRR